MSLDEAAEWAQQLGYIPERDVNLLLEAIDEELRGEPVFSDRNIDQRLFDERQALEQLDEELSRAGIDVAKVSNETIKAFLRGEVDEELVAQRAALDPDGITYDQTGQLQTDTEAFRRWFGDSKVVDAQGRPLVVYHGSPESFTEFAFTDDLGFHFGTENAARTALSYFNSESGEVRPFYLSIKNPIRARHDAGTWDVLNDAIKALPLTEQQL